MNNKYNKQFGEVIRFGIVGVVATLMQYAIYWVLVLWLNPTLAMTIDRKSTRLNSSHRT